MSLDNDLRSDYDDDLGGGTRPHRGPLLLVFGILGVMSVSCVFLGVFGIVAWVMGKRDLGLIRQGQMDKDGESLTKAGYILGIIGTILFLLQMLFWVAYAVFIVAIIASK